MKHTATPGAFPSRWYAAIRSDRGAFAILLLLALVVLAAGIGLRDPWPPDEPRFVLIARQMLQTGHWLFPHRGIELYSDKPPLFLWCEAIALWLLGGWRGAFLVPSLLAGLGTLALTWHAGRRLFDARTGLVAAAVLLVAPQFVDIVRHAQIDPLLMFWVTLGNVGILLHILRGPDWRMYWLGCFAAGLGVITKGVGVITLFMLLPYAWARWRGWPGVVAPGGCGWRWAGGALAFLAAIALWLVPMLLAAYRLHTPEALAYVHDLLFRQTMQRYADSWAHARPFWFYPTVMLRDWFPVCVLIVAMLPYWRDALRRRDPRMLVLLGWCLLVLVFFSIPSGKRALYILPALPMVALALAPGMPALLRTRWLPRAAFGLCLAGGLVLVAAGLWAMHSHPAVALRIAAGYELRDGGDALWRRVAWIGAVLLACALAFRPRRGVAALLAAMAAAWIIWPLATYPLLDGNQSARTLMVRADRIVGPQGQLALVLWREELMLQARRPVKEFGFGAPVRQQLAAADAWQEQAPSTRWVLVNDKALDDCVRRDRVLPLGTANHVRFSLLAAGAIRLGCLAGETSAPGPSGG
jgi:4-amino-4-deoxy-L-arabinose transferase-like glycosyltransferase